MEGYVHQGRITSHPKIQNPQQQRLLNLSPNQGAARLAHSSSCLIISPRQPPDSHQHGSAAKVKRVGVMAAAQSISSSSDYLFSLVWVGAVLYGVAFFLQNAYNIRVLSINEFGPVIHDLDPYFNLRATEYLYENGAEKFFTWFDHMSWYPLVSRCGIKGNKQTYSLKD